MSDNSSIPFVDLVTPHEQLKDELVNVFESALSCAGFIGGPMVESFEQSFAKYCNADHCVGVGSGTDALRFALIASGVRDGDAVVTVPNTFIATAEGISQTNARPVFVDIDERTYNIDPERLREYLETECYMEGGETVDRRLKRRVSAVVPVHLYGQTADMDPILEVAERYSLTVIEDACQAHGAEYFSRRANAWRKAGSIGKAAAFSFYPGKNLGACGEAGAVTTNDPEIARKIRMLREHGQTRKYIHEIEGYNGRLDAIQAGILRVKLRHLSQWTEQRRERAAAYNHLLADAENGIKTPHVPTWVRPVYHLYVVRVAEREALQKRLTEAGIGTGIHYPVPLHLSAPYAALNYCAGDFPVAEKAAAEILSLPMFPNLSAAQQRRVADAVQASVTSIRGPALAGAIIDD